MAVATALPAWYCNACADTKAYPHSTIGTRGGPCDVCGSEPRASVRAGKHRRRWINHVPSELLAKWLDQRGRTA